MSCERDKSRKGRRETAGRLANGTYCERDELQSGRVVKGTSGERDESQMRRAAKGSSCECETNCKWTRKNKNKKTKKGNENKN